MGGGGGVQVGGLIRLGAGFFRWVGGLSVQVVGEGSKGAKVMVVEGEQRGKRWAGWEAYWNLFAI